MAHADLAGVPVQVFRGVHWSDDVLNHENIGFWHYLQPAYNVMGFISCAGTNFLLRSAPFAQAGTLSTGLEQSIREVQKPVRSFCGSVTMCCSYQANPRPRFLLLTRV